MIDFLNNNIDSIILLFVGSIITLFVERIPHVINHTRLKIKNRRRKKIDKTTKFLIKHSREIMNINATYNEVEQILAKDVEKRTAREVKILEDNKEAISDIQNIYGIVERNDNIKLSDEKVKMIRNPVND
ncbi:MAG: hypothetical protein PHF63_04590 [Herbinix sp.]|nr:hypothetical protein [Herbinix sp.]